MAGFERLQRFQLSNLRYVNLSNAINNIYLAPGDNSLQYPDYDRWFYRTNIPRVLSGKGEIIFYADGPRIAAFVSLKKDVELKICTIMVAKEYRRMGLGTRIIVEACDWLGTSTPQWTMSKERREEFESIIENFGWKITEIIYDYKSPEYVVNGPQNIIVGSQDTAHELQDIIVGPQDTACEPQDIIVGPQDIACEPRDIIVGSQDIACEPRDIIVGSQDIACEPQKRLVKSRNSFLGFK